MFSGIIDHTGILVKQNKNEFEFKLNSELLKKIDLGYSIAVNGVCLTVKNKSKTTVTFDVMPETLNRTSFKDLEINKIVNLELPLTVNTLLSGHILQGHVDTTAKLSSIEKEGNSRALKFEISPAFLKYIVEKGSIAVNGISLTVIEVGDSFFTVGIIPYTWENTMLSTAKLGDLFNIEVDILAKYIEKLIQKK